MLARKIIGSPIIAVGVVLMALGMVVIHGVDKTTDLLSRLQVGLGR